MDLAEIQRAIEELPKDQQSALAHWLAEREHRQWEAEGRGLLAGWRWDGAS